MYNIFKFLLFLIIVLNVLLLIPNVIRRDVYAVFNSIEQIVYHQKLNP